MTIITKETPLIVTPRVMQASSLFDVPPSEKDEKRWDVTLPLSEQEWKIGLLVGPSGSGKTTVAKALWPDKMTGEWDWPEDESVLDAFPAEMGIKEITGLLSSVGFGSPPAWLRPYRTLSTGEQFRVSMARALATNPDLAVVDEFTSVVDRQVAQVAASSVAKHIRRGTGRLIAVSCHYDIVEWLQPDWIYQPHADHFQWRSVQPRPALELSVHQIDRSVWSLFRAHHYLTNQIAAGAQCFGGFIGGEIVAFTSYIHFPHARVKDIKMGHRLVVLPDWQGLGIAGALDNWLGAYLHERGYRYHNVVSHPGMVHFYANSPRWQMERAGRGVASGKRAERSLGRHQNGFSTKRMQYAFSYVPPKGG